MDKVSKFSFSNRFRFEEWYEKFLEFSPRERLIVVVGGAIVLLLLVVLPISCASSKIRKAEKNVLNHEKNMEALREKLVEYRQSTNRLRAIENQWAARGKVSIATNLESLSVQSGLDKNIDTIREQPPVSGDLLEEQIASVRLSKVPLSAGIEYLYKIENTAPVPMKVKKLQIKPRFDNRQLFDLSFDVSTFSIKGGGI